MLLRDEIDQLLINAFETDGTIRQYVGNRIGGLKHVREADDRQHAAARAVH
jgi:hypothetical protein